MDSPAIDALTRDLVLAQDGDHKALRRAIRTVDPEIRRFATWLIGNDPDVDDIVQETLLRVHRGINSFRLESQAMSWVLSITRRVCLDHLRRTKRHERLVSAVEMNTREATPRDDVELLQIHELIQSLPEQLKEVFVLVKLFGFSYSEVSQIVDCPIGTVQSRVARAREALASMILEDDKSRKTA